MWPFKERPYSGIFVKEQIDGLKKYFPEIENNIYWIKGRKNKLYYIISIVLLNWHLIFHKYDIIHFHFSLSGLFILFNPFVKIPVIMTLHGSDAHKSNKIFYRISKMLAKKVQNIFYLNDEMKKNFKEHASKMSYVPCGINTDKFRADRNINNTSKFTIAFPASKLRPEKNYQLFIKIIEILRLNIELEIELIEIHNKTRTEVVDILNLVDLVIMTSISEGSPQIIKEAMCCNTPIISTNVGDVGYLLDGVKNCYVIDSFESIDFIEPVLDILNLKPEDRESNGRTRIFELGLDEKSTSKKIYTIYENLI